MTFLTTVVVRNGPPGYCDSDYEYFYTEEYPTKCELEEFENTACQKISHVRNTQVYTKMVEVDAPGTPQQTTNSENFPANARTAPQSAT